MQLFNPSPGTIADRLTILEIKVSKANGQSAELYKELDLCWKGLGKIGVPVDPGLRNQVNDLVSSLRLLNTRHWDYEVAIRRAIQNDCREDIVELAKLFTESNDRRCFIVRQIDELFGVTPEWKSYK